MDIINWETTTDKERVRLILERVMGYFVLEGTAQGWNTPEFPKGLKAPAGFHWPIAFWNTDCECWAVRDIATDPTLFNPLRDMNDAWLVIQSVKDVDHLTLWGRKDASGYASCSLILRSAGIRYDIDCGASTMPEAICKAALKAVGIVIT